jgi:hypothetical protein
MKRILGGTLLASLAFALAAVTADAADVVGTRQERQQNRIGRGIESGQLTPREGARLEREQAKIAAEEKAFKSDGKLSRRERRTLRHDQNRASRHIWREKHDAQRR